MIIYNNFSLKKQCDKLKEETSELIEALNENDIKHIEEEFADVIVLLKQFMIEYNLDKQNIKNNIDFKIKRTLDRIKNNYY